MFENGFPSNLLENQNDIEYFIHSLEIQNMDNLITYEWKLYDNQKIVFPYRIYFTESDFPLLASFTDIKRLIYDCVFSRSADGYIRQKYIKELLCYKDKLPIWIFPYIVQISGEYVIEIVESIYCSIINKDLTELKQFCFINKEAVSRCYDRMVSYWNEYYRNSYKQLKNYVGYKLFTECFGYN